jgi:Ca-activated chloride channel family protein
VPVRMRSLFGVETRYQQQKFPIDPELLENIAQRTDGEFYRATDAKGLEERIHTILDRFERTRIKDASNVDRTELYRPMVVWAIFLIAVQMMLRHTLLRKFP